MGLVVPVLNVVSAISAFVAAYFWYRSTSVMAPYEPQAHQGEPSYGSMVLDVGGKLYDGAGTQALQAQANRRGALFAGIAAAIQGMALLVQGIAT
jgi:hypothetical protein